MCPPCDVKTMETSGFCATDSMGIAKEKTSRTGYLHDGVIYYHLIRDVTQRSPRKGERCVTDIIMVFSLLEYCRLYA